MLLPAFICFSGDLSPSEYMLSNQLSKKTPSKSNEANDSDNRVLQNAARRASLAKHASSLPIFKTGKLGKRIAFSLVMATSPNHFDHNFSSCGCAPSALPMSFIESDFCKIIVSVVSAVL